MTLLQLVQTRLNVLRAHFSCSDLKHMLVPNQFIAYDNRFGPTNLISVAGRALLAEQWLLQQSLPCPVLDECRLTKYELEMLGKLIDERLLKTVACVSADLRGFEGAWFTSIADLGHDFLGRINSEYTIATLEYFQKKEQVAQLREISNKSDAQKKVELATFYQQLSPEEKIGIQSLECAPWIPASHWWNFAYNFSSYQCASAVSHEALLENDDFPKHVAFEMSEFGAQACNSEDRWMVDYGIETLVNYFCGFCEVSQDMELRRSPLWKRQRVAPATREVFSVDECCLTYNEERLQYVTLLRKLWQKHESKIRKRIGFVDLKKDCVL